MLKFINCTIILLAALSFPLIAASNVNGRFISIDKDSSMYTVKFQINSDNYNDTLGCSTIIFNFDSASLSFPALPTNNIDYNFINFTNPNYNSKITRPLPDQIWINIESLYSNKGTIVSQTPQWTDVVQLTFKILKQEGALNLTWETTNNNWGIYDIDNSTTLQPGSWSNAANIPLPVELTSFSADIENNVIRLTWHTATELNNYGFEIERQMINDLMTNDLMTNDRGFQGKLAFVHGNGTSSSPKNYSFQDNTARNAYKYKYRLKQIDNNGDYKYSSEIEVFAKLAPLSYSLSQNYPNPFNPSTSIKFSLPDQSHVKIKIYDVVGKEIATLLNEEKPAGIYTINFDAGNLSSGVYLYRIICNNFTQVKKMLLLK